MCCQSVQHRYEKDMWWDCNSWTSEDTPPGFPFYCNFRSLESEENWQVGPSSPDISLLNRNRMSLIVGLHEFQTFSFRFTQRLNTFCFELTRRCQGSIPFLVSVMVSSSTHTTLQWTHLRATAVQSLTQASATVCVCHCLWDFWIILKSVFFFFSHLW